MLVVEGVGDGLPVIIHLGRVRRRPPVKGDCVGRLERIPGVVCNDSDTIADFNDVLHTGHCFRRRRIVAIHRAALARIKFHRGIQHAVDVQVDAIVERAGGLANDIDALHWLAQ